MVIHSLLLKGPPPHLEKKEEVIVAIGLLPLLGKKGVVVMVIHLFLLSVSSLVLGKGWQGGMTVRQ